MKKYFKFLFVGFIVVAMLIACSKPQTTSPASSDNGSNNGTSNNNSGEEQTKEEKDELVPEEGASLILWDNADQEMAWAKYVAEEFEKKYGVKVEVQEVAHVDAAGKLEVDGPAGLGADVFHAPHDHVGNMVSAGLILPNMVADEYYKNFMDAAINGTSFTEDGESLLYGFPIAIETYALYYNKDLVDQPAETFGQLIEQSKEFMTSNPGSYGFMMEVGNFYYNYAFLAGFGGYIFGNNETDPTDLGLNSDGALKSAEFMRKLRDEILPLKNEDITGNIISSFFNEGQLMYRISGPWDIKNHTDAGVNFGIAPLPKLDNGKTPKSFSGVKAYYVNSYSKYPKAATLLAQFASSEEMLEKRFEMTGQIPPHKALLESESLQADEYAMAFLEQALSAVPMPNIPEMQTVWDPMGTAYVTIWNENIDPQQILDSAKQQVEDGIAQMQN